MKKLLVSIPVEHDGFVNVHLANFLQGLAGKLPGWRVKVEYLQAKPVAATRNHQCRSFLSGPCDYMLCIDADAVPDREGLSFLLDAIEREDVDAVGGWSLMKSDRGPIPCVQQYHEDKPADPHDRILSQPPGLYEIEDGGIGAHCLMLKRATVQRFYDEKDVWFKDTLRDGSLERFQIADMLVAPIDKDKIVADLQWWMEETEKLDLTNLGGRIKGQDVWFCLQCHRLGLRLWVDTRVLWGHVKYADLRGEFVEVLRLRQQLREATCEA